MNLSSSHQQSLPISHLCASERHSIPLSGYFAPQHQDTGEGTHVHDKGGLLDSSLGLDSSFSQKLNTRPYFKKSNRRAVSSLQPKLVFFPDSPLYSFIVPQTNENGEGTGFTTPFITPSSIMLSQNFTDIGRRRAKKGRNHSFGNSALYHIHGLHIEGEEANP